MRTRAITVPVLLVAIGGLAGCGSSSSSSQKTSAGPSGTTAANGGTVPSRTYTVKLSGSAEVPKGAPGGAGTATISMRGAKRQVCWSFHLTGVPAPAVAHIHAGGAGVSGPVFIPLGAAYKRTGCTSALPRSELAAIVAGPRKYYVNVHNAKYPKGAVRSQL